MLKRIIAVFVGVISVLAVLTSINSAKAADPVAGRGSITVSPISFELYANPGDSLSEKIRVRNDSGADMNYQILIEDFKAVGEEGSVDTVLDQSNSSFSLAKWVVPEPKNISIKNGQEKEVQFSINVPKDAEPGGHYASILVKMGGGDIQNGAAVASRVGSLILLRVAGNIKEESMVESFKADKGYYQSGPVNFDLRVKNNGNNHVQPKGTILITNLFGQKIAEIPLNGKNALPGAIRRMDTEWSPGKFLANRYTATLVANYGQQSKTLSASTSFIIFPKALLITSISIILLIALMFIFKKNIKNFIHKLSK